ncbi:hypothetical protein [Aquabacterium sp.]|uniref:hypothetical protein n=1 Tax=Aquabacterium sp. TaxID=1872578 RepID=UPI0040377799
MAKEPTTILLDSDIVAYKFSSANQKDFDWNGDGNKVSVLQQDIEVVAQDTFDYIEELKDKLKAAEVIVCLSCPTSENFRLKVYPDYKGNRDPNAKPLQLALVKEKMATQYPSYARPNLEADDIMGILSTHPNIVKGRKVIVSEDKDMQTIPGLLYNPRKDTKVRTITREQADRYHLYQTLIGDATDFYPGCPGIGPDKAEKFLDAPFIRVPYLYEFKRGPRKGTSETRYSDHAIDDDSVWDGIVSLYEAAGKDEAFALAMARVARILRCTDYDFTNKEPILWTP